MSRIGRQPVIVTDQVKVEVAANNCVTVTGPKGVLELQVNPRITVSEADGRLTLSRATEQKRDRAMHGLYRALLQNMVIGVTEGFTKELDVIGVGTRAEVKRGVLELALGHSHPIFFVPPEGITLTSTGGGRGTVPRVTVSGIDKQVVGQVAAKIRALRPPEPYKGKGIRYRGEYVRRKAGKTASK